MGNSAAGTHAYMAARRIRYGPSEKSEFAGCSEVPRALRFNASKGDGACHAAKFCNRPRCDMFGDVWSKERGLLRLQSWFAIGSCHWEFISTSQASRQIQWQVYGVLARATFAGIQGLSIGLAMGIGTLDLGSF